MILLVPLQLDKAGDRGWATFLYLECSFLSVFVTSEHTKKEKKNGRKDSSPQSHLKVVGLWCYLPSPDGED